MTPELALPSALDELDRPQVVQAIAQVADALHAAGLTPTHELAVGLLYLGQCIATECPRRTM